MARVLWDGEKIVATASKSNYQELNRLAEKYQAEPLPAVNGYAFDRTVQTVLDIAALKGTAFDPSFEDIVKKVNLALEKKKNDIESYGFPKEMYPFQKEAVAQLLKWNHSALLASDMGCGKSCMASVYLRWKPNSFPALVVCPASLKTNWAVEIEKWTPGVKTYIINGRETYNDLYVLNSVKQADVIIMNYDILGIDDKEAIRREKERIKRAKEEGRPYRKAFIPVHGWAEKLMNEVQIKTIVCDEVQAIETTNTIRTRAVTQIAVNESITKLFLSGTPFETRVSQFYTACHLIAPHMFPKEWDFKQRYCAPYYNGFGWEYKGVSNLDELRERLSTFMIRHRKEDVLKQLPKKQRIPIYFDMDAQSRASYDKMEDELLAQDSKIHQFSYLAKMKQSLMEIKIETVVQFIKDMLEVEDKVVVFAFHTKMFNILMDEFKGQCVGIDGSTPTEKRQGMIDSFQKDDKTRVFIGQIVAASTGITLTASHTVIFTEWGMTCGQHKQGEDRVHRIGQEADRCIAYYLIIKDTIDEGPLETLGAHNADIEAVMDGKEDAQFVDINESMIAKVKQRKLMRNKQAVQIEYK